VDYLKYDWCFTLNGLDAKTAYTNIRHALDASGRPIVLSICEWGTHQPWLWGAEAGGNLWRTTGDIQDRLFEWCDDFGPASRIVFICRAGTLERSRHARGWQRRHAMTEYRAQFSLWAILAAPLIAGNDLRNMSPDTRDILTNKEVIAVNQDPLGREGRSVWKDGNGSVSFSTSSL
jgi:alpha-galactosidase